MEKARAALAPHPKCGAKWKQIEGFCINPAMKNGRCYIHWGRSTCTKPQHGQSSRTAKDKRQEIRELIKKLN
jgi:hypothetical protein